MNAKLIELNNFLESGKRDATDFELVRSPDEWLVPLLGEGARRFFRVFLRNRGGDLLAEWDPHGELGREGSLPVAWLSSDGSPHTVVARDAEGFLSLLPLGGEVLQGLPLLIAKHKQKPAIVVAPEKKFSDERVRQAFSYQATKFPDHASLVALVEDRLGIPINFSPVSTVRGALDAFPALQGWVETSLT